MIRGLEQLFEVLEGLSLKVRRNACAVYFVAVRHDLSLFLINFSWQTWRYHYSSKTGLQSWCSKRRSTCLNSRWKQTNRFQGRFQTLERQKKGTCSPTWAPDNSRVQTGLGWWTWFWAWGWWRWSGYVSLPCWSRAPKAMDSLSHWFSSRRNLKKQLSEEGIGLWSDLRMLWYWQLFKIPTRSQFFGDLSLVINF